MALADILKRIDRDADDEANRVLLEAQRKAEESRARAEATAAARHDAELARTESQAGDDARTKLASARLRGRDRILGEKRVLIDRVLQRAIERIEALPDSDYARLLAREIAAVARGGERVLVARSDAERLSSALPAMLEQAGAKVEVAGATDTVERGVVLEGSRMRIEISPWAMVVARRAELESEVSADLFGGEG